MCSAIRVAICGAGPSGLSQLHAFESARQSGCEIPSIVCFEKQDDLGGQWNYTWRTGLDEYSEPVHSSMYQNLWTNLPKECSEFVDYTFDQHFGQPVSSFPPRTVFYDYIRGYAEKTNIRQYIQFKTVVRWITYSDETKKFTVLIKNLEADRTRSEEFDYVIVATGHFSTPNIPYYPGIETFPGRILHSHDFRSAHDLVHTNVLLIGNNVSAEDIALQLYKHGAKSIQISYRTTPKGYKWPNQIQEVPLVTRIDKETVYFKDGTFTDVQCIIYCTGYIHHFPFLADDLRLKATNSLYIPDLYKTIVFLPQPRLFYLGMLRLTLGFNIGNVQAWYVRDVILGRILLPLTNEQMKQDVILWLEKERQVKNMIDSIYFQRDYILDLAAATNYPKFDIDQMAEILIDCIKARSENIITYREKTYPSVFTKTMAKKHHTLWLDEMDDTFSNFVKK